MGSLLLDPFQNIVNVQWTGKLEAFYIQFRYYGGGHSFNLPLGIGSIDIISPTACIARGYTIDLYWVADQKYNDFQMSNLPPGYVLTKAPPPPPPISSFSTWAITGAHILSNPATETTSSKGDWTFYQKGGSSTATVPIGGYIIHGQQIGYWGTPPSQIGDPFGQYAGGWYNCDQSEEQLKQLVYTVSGINLTVDGKSWFPVTTSITISPQVSNADSRFLTVVELNFTSKEPNP